MSSAVERLERALQNQQKFFKKQPVMVRPSELAEVLTLARAAHRLSDPETPKQLSQIIRSNLGLRGQQITDLRLDDAIDKAAQAIVSDLGGKP